QNSSFVRDKGNPTAFNIVNGFSKNLSTSFSTGPVAKVVDDDDVNEGVGDKSVAETHESRSPRKKDRTAQGAGGGVGWAVTAALAGAFVVTLRAFVVDVFVMGSPAMDPTLATGDRVMVDKLSYQWRSPERGEILVFDPPRILREMRPQADQPFILRVVGVPGDRLRIQGGQLYVNGQPLRESYLKEPITYEMAQVTIPEDTYFVLGDNRNDSFDSSIWGIVPTNKILGKATSVVYPLGKFGGL
ncbi:MAG: signal peptidase I, partial [Cyanobacteria bacterium P01_F01_bin.153]